MKRLIAIALLMLAGCTTTRYVSVPCVTGEQYDQLKNNEPPRVKDRLTGKADQDIKTIGGSNIRLRAWGEGMLGVLGGCVG